MCSSAAAESPAPESHTRAVKGQRRAHHTCEPTACAACGATLAASMSKLERNGTRRPSLAEVWNGVSERTLPRGQPCPRCLGGLHGICPGVACLRSAAVQGSMPNKSNALRRLIEQLAAMHLHHGLAQVAHGVTEVEERTAWVY